MKKILLLSISILFASPFTAWASLNNESKLTANLLFVTLINKVLNSRQIEIRNVTYSDGDIVMKGYLAYNPKIKGKRPGVLVVHEWWGLSDYMRQRTRMLATLGYTAMAVDMYGNGKQVTHPEDAEKLSAELMNNFDTAKGRFLAALNYLKKQKNIDTQNIAAVGYCFGGGTVLNMARQGIGLKGVVSFHGGLTPVKPAKPGDIKARILVLNGADDKFITKEQIESFKQEMKNARADYHVISYPGAMHGFTNPDSDKISKKFNISLGYNAEADQKSWMEMTKFLNENF
ncbi:MAG: dienelactone hydrolase family protein [Smithella sp.]